MKLDTEDTIAAIASPAGAGFRGIIRMSGPTVLRTLASVFPLSNLDTKSPTRSSTSIDIGDGSVIDGDLMVWPTNRSYTRQPSAEFHTIGSPPLLKAMLRHICQHGCRVARPGEFTLRAFLGGRLDLTQAEAVLAVIDSTDKRHFDVALQQLAGGLAGPLDTIRNELINVLQNWKRGSIS